MKKAIIFIIFFCVQLGLYAQTVTKIEAESGTLTNGATKVTDATRSGGAYVQTLDGEITFNITLTTAKYFDFDIFMSSPNGDKTNNFLIDANSVAFTMANTANYSLLKIASATKLNAGTHTIKITKSWGWINVDYIQMTEIDASSLFNINPNLCNSNPSNEAKCLYDFLISNYNKNLISGVMTLNSFDDSNWLKTNIGKEPVVLGIDFMQTNRKYSWYDDNTPTNDAKTWYQKNGIPTMMWHWRDPSRTTEEFYTKNTTDHTNGTSFDITKINDPNSAEYKAMISDIDFVAGKLKILRDANIPVIWRPLHEAAGGWFWWGAKGGAACKKLYQVMYDRMVHYHGLNNLIWVWTYEPKEDGTWYPGDSIVDIVGRDIYKDLDHTSQIIEFNSLNARYNKKKMITLSECGSFPDIDNVVTDGAAWSWYMPWYGSYTEDGVYNSKALWQKMFASSNCITLDEMPAWSTQCIANKAPTVSITLPANNAIYTAPATVTINATANDADGTITKVDFYNGSTLLGSDATSPYSYSWTGVVAGTDTIKAIATDNKGATTTSTAIIITVQKTQTVSLVAGWNLISFNVQPTDSTIATVFGGLSTNLVTVKNADAFYDPTQSVTYNSLSKIKPGDAYFVKVKINQSISVIGTIVKPNTYSLKLGWNLIGFPQQASAAIATATTGITTQFISTKNFDGFYIKGGASNSISTFDPCKGYFIKMNANTNITW